MAVEEGCRRQRRRRAPQWRVSLAREAVSGCSWRFRKGADIDNKAWRDGLPIGAELLLLHGLHRLAKTTVEDAIDGGDLGLRRDFGGAHELGQLFETLDR